MTMQTDLERRRNALRSLRVQTRKRIEWLEKSGGDRIERQRLVEAAQMVLRSTEREWAELGAMLGTSDLPPVRLLPTASTRKQQPPRLATRSVATGYVTRMMDSAR